MVHLRVNEREPNPNPYVNFITVLPMHDPTVEEAARQLLRALAAQVRPIMKEHGFVINSFEEYEYNRVFAGRNWNHGETVGDSTSSSSGTTVGSLFSPRWLMSTLCHELAHIKHMDHGSAFQALWRQLQQEVCALQNRGYYGDGCWSSGNRLADSVKIAGQDVEMGEFPEYMCGGAHSRARPASGQSRKHQGPQASKRRKAGSRVNSSAFNTIGTALNEDLEGQSKLHGIGFRRKATSKRAREERALAAEQRVQTLRGRATSGLSTSPTVEYESGSDDGGRDTETDNDRRRTLLEVIKEKDLDALRATTLNLAHDFLLPNGRSSGEQGGTCPRGSSNGSSDGTSPSDTTSVRPKKKRKTLQLKLVFPHETPATTKIVKARRQEDLWACVVCTLNNEPAHLACSACGTPRGESTWP